MADRKTPEHVKFRLVPKTAPPSTSWWTCPDADFAKNQREEQKRMSGGSEQVYAKANGEEES